jgi:hypothetical protein
LVVHPFSNPQESVLTGLRKSREHHDTDRITYRCFLPAGIEPASVSTLPLVLHV